MRNSFSKQLILLLLLWVPLGSFAQFLNWDYVNVTDDVRQSGVNPDMVVDNAGTIHISYWHRDQDKLMYMYRGPGDPSWTREYVDVNGLNGYVSSIALNPDGNPTIAYQENVSFVAQIRFATRTAANTWLVESIPGDAVRGWGGYGPNAFITEKERVVHSIDLVFDENGEPQIAFFDGWMNVDAFPACTRNSQYGFQLHQAWKQSGSWMERSLGLLPDKNLSCGTGSAPDTLPNGDRYGEFVNLLQRSDGRMDIYCLSRFNNRLMHFQNLLPVIDSVWVAGEIDSLPRILGPNFSWSKRWFTIEGISATISADDNAHLAYTTSLFYGENFCCTSSTNDLIYTRITPTDTFYHSFGAATYRNYTDITTRGGSDSIFIAYSDLNTFQFLMQTSVDSGQTWVKDTIADGIGVSRSPVEIVGDSLHVLFYNAEKENMVMARRHVDGGDWRLEIINESERKGHTLDAIVKPVGGDTVTHIVYTDGFKDELYYVYGTQNNAWNWSFDQLDISTTELKAISMALSSAEDPVLAYGGGDNGDLRLAARNSGNWSYEVVDSAVAVGFTDIEISSLDTIHVVYYDDNLNCLKYAWKHLQDSLWNYDVIDCANQPVGEYPSLQLDAQEHPHVAYYDDSRLSLMYASQNQGTRAWDVDSINGSIASGMGKFASLKFGPNGLPKVAYLDEQATSVFLSEKTIAGGWSHELVDSASITNIGRPIQLEIDQFGKVWVAYNYYTNFDKVKLMHRDGGNYNEIGVSSTGWIAGAFQFDIVGGDLFIVGRKNQLVNTGVGMLLSPQGLYVELPDPDDLANAAQIINYPNPFSETTNFRIELTRAQTLDLEVYDLYGKRVATVISGTKLGSGVHEFAFDASGLAPGMYIFELRNDRSRMVKKMILAR